MNNEAEKKTTILAVAGKGGVGKTSIAATMVKVLKEAYPDKKILAIDADPAVGLSTALGIEVETTIDDIRKEVIANVKDGESKAAVELLGEARYRIFDALVESEGFSFIAIGRPEAAGCYCKINSYLKEVISILAENFDYIVIDGEAGIEQINRRVMEKVSHLILVTDSSKKGTQVIATIKSVADELVMYERIGVIANRLPSKDVVELMNLNGMELLSEIVADTELQKCDLKGESVLNLADDDIIVKGVKEALVKIEVI